MKIKVLENIAGLNFSYSVGEVVEVSEEIAIDLIKVKYAEEIKVNKKSGDK